MFQVPAKSSDAKHGGRRNGAGRKKGVPNKLTADVKEAIMAAFSEVGGHEYLRKIARTHPQVFCALLGKILPSQTQVSGDAANPLHTYDRIEVVVIDPKEQCDESLPHECKMEDTKNPSAAAPPDLKKKGPKSSDAKHGGRRNGAGRKKGVPNKLTADVKEAIMAAFSEVGGHELPEDVTWGGSLGHFLRYKALPTLGGLSSNGTELLGKCSDADQGITLGQPVLQEELLQHGSRQL